MSLKIYHKKRNFKLTPEPKGKVESTSTEQLYVIQKHAASHLHYDFRLEINGVLKSWAIPKGPSLDPAVKRLAVHVEDHPLAYGHFEGIIPKGSYGGGTVMLWDIGHWQADENLEKSYKKGHMTFILSGHKLHGIWNLVKLKDDKNWLLIKGHDEFIKNQREYDVTKALPNSIISNKSIDQIAATPAST